MITVTTENDERMFNATSWVIDAGCKLEVFDGDDVVACYAPGGWQYVHKSGSEVGRLTTAERGEALAG